MSDVIDQMSAGFQGRFKKNETIQSFQEFLDNVKKDPARYCRNSAQYVKDVFDYYGSYEATDINGEKIRRWALFDQFRPVYGLERAQNQIYNIISSFAKNRINKIILLHGPNGSAKTSLIASIMKAVETYSQLPEGAVYTFNWVFSDTGDKQVSLGFNGENKKYQADSLAHVDPDDITFKLVCAMKDNPLLLVPLPERAELLESLGISRPHHLYEAELSQKSKEIFNQLAISYDGDWTKIIRHVQVERFYFSKLFRRGLITIDPCPSVDATCRPLNIELSYRIPAMLATTSMYEPYGDIVDANRGICELTEILKRRVDHNKYLLTTAEWGTLSLPGLTVQLDCLIFGTENEKNLSLFRYDPDWPSFNGRFAYVRVPYLLKWSDEEKVVQRILDEHVKDMHIAPHTSASLALWAVMTRLRSSRLDPAKHLSSSQKTRLYNKQQTPDGWTQKERQNLLRDLGDVADEYVDSRDRKIHAGGELPDASYEGRTGASFRDVENIVVDAIHRREHLSPLTLINTIKEILKNKSIYEFTRLGAEATHKDTIYEEGFASPNQILKEMADYYVQKVKQDLRRAAGLVDDTEYDKLFDRYIQNVKAWISSQRVLNPQTGNWEPANEKLMRSIEQKMGVSDSAADTSRRDMFNKIAAWSLNNDVTKGVPYKSLFSELLEKLRHNSDQEKREQLGKLQTWILYHKTDDWKLVPEEHRDQVTRTIDTLLASGYTDGSLKEAIGFVVRSES